MRNCPRDHQQLVDHQIGEFKVHHCKSCSGLWVPPSVVCKIAGHLPQLEPFQKDSWQTTRCCPEDGATLVAIRHKDVEIDICSKCGGVWFDKGELERILRKESNYSAAEAVGEVLGNVDITFAGDLAGAAIGTVFEFLCDALSGL